MLTTVGIHPLAAVGVVTVDSMLFGGTMATGGVGWTASVPVGIALGVAVGLIQLRGHDALGLAVGKRLMVAVLTAIPTPLPSALVAGAGTAGAFTMLRDRRRRKRLGSGRQNPAR